MFKNDQLIALITDLFNIYDQFWRQHPSLLYGLSFLLGVSIVLEFHPILFLPIMFLYFPLIFHQRCCLSLIKRLLLGVLFLFSSLIFVKYMVYFTNEANSTYVQGRFSITTLEELRTSFGNQWVYKGYLKYAKNEENKIVAKNIPCTILSKIKKNEVRPLADKDYFIKGVIKPNPRKSHSQYLKTTSQWTPFVNSYSFAELRFQAKKILSRYIDQNITKKRSAIFLKGISTGEFHDKEMKFEFSRFGLQHIMAISGFHFTIIAAFFNLILKIFVTQKRAACILIFILCGYFLFLGSSPSVMRAWLMIVISLGGSLLERKGTALNSLGITLLIILAFDPFMIKHIGFQFSSMITGSILINFGIFDTLMQSIFPKRKLYQVIEMNLWNKHGYCLIVYLRKAIALTLAVNIVSLPLSLYHFEKFPWMAIIYNWFFPFLVSFSLILLILGFLFFFIPPLAIFIHSLNNAYTSFVLNFAYNLPTTFDYYLRAQNIDYKQIIIILSCVIITSILTKCYLSDKHEKKLNFL